MPDPNVCGACGSEVKTRVFDRSIWVERDPRSQEVHDALMDKSEDIFPDPAPHPLCDSCFIGWLHNWLGVG
jgi:hypothetical protein